MYCLDHIVFSNLFTVTFPVQNNFLKNSSYTNNES